MPDELIQEELKPIEENYIRSVIKDDCLKCRKCEYHCTIPVDKDLETVHQVNIIAHASPLDVVLTEQVIKIPKRVTPTETNPSPVVWHTVRFYKLYRCTDEMCLLRHLRDSTMIVFIDNLRKQEQAEIDKLRFNALKEHKSRRAHRRDRAKAKSNG